MKYRKKPVVIDAFLWTGGPDQLEDPEWIVEAIKAGTVTIYRAGEEVKYGVRAHTYMAIATLEGVIHGSIGDYIIRGVKGEIYPCKPDIFALTYEAAE